MTQPTQKTLTEILRPIDHQRVIDRLSRQINPATPTLNEGILAKIEWHTKEYLKKTGELPR